MILIIRIIRVTLPALDVFANCEALPGYGVPEAPVTQSQNEPISGRRDRVDTRSSQKKKVIK